MAVDFQGVAKVRPFVEQAAATFTTVVDAENLLGEQFGFKAIPNGIFVDAAGLVRYTRFGGFDIRTPATRALVEAFVQEPDLAEVERQAEAADGIESDQALDLFQAGLKAYRAGDVKHAVSAWREAVVLEPDNWIIRKQLWAVEHPEKFYAGDVDFDWQREQIAQGM